MRVESTPDRLELEFTILTGGCLAVALVLVVSPFLMAAIVSLTDEKGEALAPAGFGLGMIALLYGMHWLTKARCVLDRFRNEVTIERKGLAPGEGLLPLDAIEGAEVFIGGEEDTFYKPALRIRGRREPLVITGFGNATRNEADAAVDAILAWLGKRAATSPS